MEVMISTAPDPSDPGWESHGQWWLPEDPDHKIGGVLNVSAEGRSTLVLSGGLNVGGMAPHHRTILGKTGDNEPLTLAEAYLAGSSMSGIGSEALPIEQTWRARTLFRKGHFPEGSSTRFSSMSVVTSYLADWAPTPPLDIDSDGLDTTIKLQFPHPIQAETDLGRVSLRWSQRKSTSQKHHTFSITPAFVLEPASPMDLEALWESFVVPVVFLMTFCTGQPNGIVNLTVSVGAPGDTEAFQYAQIVTPKWRRVRPGDDAIGSWNHLLPFDAVEEDFEEVWRRWFVIVTEQHIPLLEFFSVLLDERMFLDESFLRVVRAIESWHRRRFDGQILAEAQYQDMLARIKAALPSEEWKLAKMRLEHANQLTLKERLDDLIKRAGEPLQAIMQGGYQRFTRRVTLTRNHIVHGGTEDPAVFSNEEMAWARPTLEILFLVSILDALGYADEAPSLVRRTELFRVLTDTFNILSTAWHGPRDV